MKPTGPPRRSCSPCRKHKTSCTIAPGATKCQKCTKLGKPCTISGEDFVPWAAIHLKPTTERSLKRRPVVEPSWVSKPLQALYKGMSELSIGANLISEKPGFVPNPEDVIALNVVIQNQTDRQFFATYTDNLFKITTILSQIDLDVLNLLITDNYFDHHYLILPVPPRIWATTGQTSKPLWLSRPLLAASLVLGSANNATGKNLTQSIRLDTKLLESLYDLVSLTFHHVLASAVHDSGDAFNPLVPLDVLMQAFTARHASYIYWSRKRGGIIGSVANFLCTDLYYKYDLIHLDKYSEESESYPSLYLKLLWGPGMEIEREALRRAIVGSYAFDWVYVTLTGTFTSMSSKDLTSLSPLMPESMWMSLPNTFSGYPLDNPTMKNLEWMYLPRDDPIRRAGLSAVADLVNNEIGLFYHFTYVLFSMTLEATYGKDEEFNYGTPPLPTTELVTLIYNLVEDFIEALPEPVASMYKANDVDGIHEYYSQYYGQVLVSRIFAYFLRLADVTLRMMVVCLFETNDVAKVIRILTFSSFRRPINLLPLTPPQDETLAWFTIVPPFMLEQVLAVCLSTSLWIKKWHAAKTYLGWASLMMLVRNALIFTALARLLEDAALKASFKGHAMSMLTILGEVEEFEKVEDGASLDGLGDVREWGPLWFKALVELVESDDSRPLVRSDVAKIISLRLL